MPKKIIHYLSELMHAHAIEDYQLLSKTQTTAALEKFSDTSLVKLSKKEKITPFSVVRDDAGTLFSIYNPDKKEGVAIGAQGMIKIAQNIQTGTSCLVKVQKIPMSGMNAARVQQVRQERKFLMQTHLLYGYQERINDKNELVCYLFMRELPGIPVVDGYKPDESFETLYASKLTLKQQLTLLRNLLMSFIELSNARIIHRDLYPRNILVDPEDNFKTYFVDWGKSLESDSNGFCLDYAEHDFQKKKKVRFANGFDFLALTETFSALNLLEEKEIQQEVTRLVRACGNLKTNYNRVDVTPLFEIVNTRLLLQAQNEKTTPTSKVLL